MANANLSSIPVITFVSIPPHEIPVIPILEASTSGKLRNKLFAKITSATA